MFAVKMFTSFIREFITTHTYSTCLELLEYSHRIWRLATTEFCKSPQNFLQSVRTQPAHWLQERIAEHCLWKTVSCEQKVRVFVPNSFCFGLQINAETPQS